VALKRIKKGMTNKQYIHGDYDGDGTANIDDKRPFDKKRDGRVNPEVSLSKTFKYIESKRRAAKRIAKKPKKTRKIISNILF